MSYRHYVDQPAESHRLNEFVPNYVPHSDYLTSNRVVDNNIPEAQKWVFLLLSRWLLMTNRSEEDRCTPRDRLISTLSAMCPSELTRM